MEREASAKGIAFYDSTFNRPFPLDLNKRLNGHTDFPMDHTLLVPGDPILWWGIHHVLTPTACLLQFSASWHWGLILSRCLPHCSCASLPKGSRGWVAQPAVARCAGAASISTWLCGLLFFRERMSTARLGGGKIKVWPSEWDPLTPLNRLALSLISDVGKAGAFGLREGDLSGTTVLHEAASTVHCGWVVKSWALLQNLGLHPITALESGMCCERRHLEVKGQHVTSHLLENPCSAENQPGSDTQHPWAAETPLEQVGSNQSQHG